MLMLLAVVVLPLLKLVVELVVGLVLVLVRYFIASLVSGRRPIELAGPNLAARSVIGMVSRLLFWLVIRLVTSLVILVLLEDGEPGGLMRPVVDRVARTEVFDDNLPEVGVGARVDDGVI